MSRSRDRRQRAEARSRDAVAAEGPGGMTLTIEGAHGTRLIDSTSEGGRVGVCVIGGHNNYVVHGRVYGAETAVQLREQAAVSIIAIDHRT